MKNSVRLLAGLGLCLALVACGAQGSNKAASTEPVTITFYTWAQFNDYPDNLIKAFEAKNPNIKVNLEVGSQNVQEYLQMQKVKLLAKEGLDVTALRPESRQDYVTQGYLVDLTDQPFLANYNKDYLGLVAVNGKVYSVPYALDVIGTIYNKTMFKEHGWKEPTNQQEWLALADTIQKAGIKPVVNGYKDGWPILPDVTPFIHEVLVKDPAIFEKIDKGEAKYTDPAFLDAVKKIQTYYKKHVIPKEAAGLSYDQAAAYFSKGKAAMMVHGEWVVGSIESSKPTFELGVMPVFHNAEGEPLVAAASIGQSVGVTSFTKNKEASLKFVEFLSSPEGAQFFADSMSNFTPVTGVKSAKTEPWQALLTLPARDFYFNLQYPGAQSEFQKSLQLMFIGELTPEGVLKNTQAAQDKKGKS